MSNLNTMWQSRGWVAWLLTPVSLLFWCIVLLRAKLFKAGVLKVNTFAAPVIVVGNISVGGTGKTPIVSAVVKRLQLAGKKPGIVSRGYGATAAKTPRRVDATTSVELSGDEPLLLACDTGVPICICADRSAAVEWLIANNDVDVVVSDDGMQHYAMHRDIEIAVVDGQRTLGNGWLLPAGPLREPPSRLHRANIVAVQQAQDATDAYKHKVLASLALPGKRSVMDNSASNGKSSTTAVATGHFYLEISKLLNLANGHLSELQTLCGQQVHAVAGLGNPQRFFASLRAAGLEVIEHAMPDHHRYTPGDIAFNDPHPILVTAKDAVKIRSLNIDLTRLYEVPVTAILDSELDQAVDKLIETLV